jgi:hypothetical protein
MLVEIVVTVVAAVVLVPLLLFVAVQRWAAVCPRFGRWIDKRATRVSPRLGRWIRDEGYG